MSPNDRDLIERMKAGDKEAGDTFFGKYIDLIYGDLRANLRVATEQDLQDLCSEICRAILEELHRYDQQFAVITWVNMLVERHRQRFIAGRRAHQGRTVSLDEIMNPGAEQKGLPRLEPVAATPDPLIILESKEKIDRASDVLQMFLATLGTDANRDVFIDRHLGGLSYGEIAVKRDISLDAVKGRLKRSRQGWVTFLKERGSIE